METISNESDAGTRKNIGQGKWESKATRCEGSRFHVYDRRIYQTEPFVGHDSSIRLTFNPPDLKSTIVK